MSRPARGTGALRLCMTAACLLALQACGSVPKSYVVLLDSPDGAPPSVITVTNEKGTRTLNQPGQYVGLEEAPGTASRTVSASMIKRDFAGALAAEPPEPRSFLLYFLSGSVALTESSVGSLADIVAEAGIREVPEIVIIGHTDTAGSARSNAALASRRAETIKTMVIDAGLAPDLIEVTSYGEHKPLVATADDVDEPRNRRVEVVIR